MLPTSSLRSLITRQASIQASSWQRIVALSSFQQAQTLSSVRFFSEGERLHSTDIAFKPAESGWGGGNKYSNNFDTIFANNSNKKTENSANEATATTKSDGEQSAINKEGGDSSS